MGDFRVNRIALLSLVLMGIHLPPAYSQPLPEDEAARIGRLDQLARDLEKVKVDKVRSTGPQRSEERRSSKHSELHFRFLVCVSGLVADNQDGRLIFPLQISGLTSELNSAEQGANKRDSGADFQKIQVTLAGVRKARPKVKIEVPKLRHGSVFDAVQLVRDEIISRVRNYFPDAEIEGRQKFLDKHFEIKNEARESVQVKLHYRTLRRNDTKSEWGWQPGLPPNGEAIRFAVSSGSKSAAKENSSDLIRTSGVRFSAEGDSGEEWLEHKSDVLWLVDENPELDGERAYYAEKPQMSTHTIKPKTGKREFAERVLEFNNQAGESLQVALRYESYSDGQLVWKSEKYQLEPGKSFVPRKSDGARIRASRIYLVAESAARRYVKYAQQPLWLVDEVAGRRSYYAESIGKFVYSFGPSSEGASTDMARVTAASARIVAGTQTLATVGKDQSYKVVDKRPGWVAVQADIAGKSVTGWIREQDVRVSSGPSLTPQPSLSPKTLTIISNAAELKLGSTIIAPLLKGEQYQVLEERGGWYRIEISFEGSPRHGWVNDNHVRIK